MMLAKWEDLPADMRTEPVREYYTILERKRGSLFFKRVFDIVVSLIMLILLSPVFLILAIAIKIDSEGPVFFRQVRVTQYGKEFRIHKFRSMVNSADKGSQVTVSGDSRVTRVGRWIRGCRLDEISQLIDVLQGNMTFVGVRPEVPKYVACYTDEMKATLLLPAGVTNLTSIYYADEAKLLDAAADTDKVYIEDVLPQKMAYNLKGIKEFSFWGDIKLMFMTFFAMCGKTYREEPIDADTKSGKERENMYS